MHSYRAWFLDQLAMYTAYHRDRRNQLTHHIGVPLIVFSILLALTQAGGDPVNLPAGILTVLLLLYVLALPVIGIITAVFYAVVLGIATMIGVGAAADAWPIAIGAFVIGWIIQFVGHIFEGRRPAFTTNIIQLLIAPPFLIAEMLFALGLAQALEKTLMARSIKYNPVGEPRPA